LKSRVAKLAFLSSALLASFGCGADPSYSSNARSSSGSFFAESQTRTPASPEAPPETVAQLQACVDRFAPDLSSDSYAILLDLEATKSGKVTKVKVKDSMIAGSAVEACLLGALKRMAVPATAINTRHEVSPQSRSMVGVAQAAAAPIALLPIALTAAGVTILVGVTIYVVAHAVDDVRAEQERSKSVASRSRSAA
jgi:hypothetical protein